MNNYMTNKERYEQFCASTYTPIYSKPWWMDAVCGPENWDVWLYESGGTVLAAMPYYMEQRGPYRYITKAPLTQNNGIIFKEEPNQKLVTKMEMQERIINAACAFIQSLGLDVYEQQYSPSFQNWLPFFWNNYTAITRYTYVIENTSDLDYVMQNIEKADVIESEKGSKKQNCTRIWTATPFILIIKRFMRNKDCLPHFQKSYGKMFILQFKHINVERLYFEQIAWEMLRVFPLSHGMTVIYISLSAALCRSCLTWKHTVL